MPETTYPRPIVPVETHELRAYNGKTRGEHYVYLASDVRGRLLYIGRTSDVYRRMAEHSRTSEWYDQMAHLKIEVFHMRDDAQRHEAHLIRLWSPPFNVSLVDRRTGEQLRWARQHAEWRRRRVPAELKPTGGPFR